MLQQMQKHRDDLRVERDHLKAQTVEQQDMIFDVQNQVRYLNNELERNRLTLVNLQTNSMRDVLRSEMGSPSVISMSNSQLREYDEEGHTDSEEGDHSPYDNLGMGREVGYSVNSMMTSPMSVGT